MILQANGLAFPSQSKLGLGSDGIANGILDDLMISQLMGRYSTLAKAGKLFSAYATVTAPVAFSTAAGLGGPLLWNRPASTVDAHLLAIGVSTSVASTVAGGLGLTSNTCPTAPTATTAIDGGGSMLTGGPNSQLDRFRIGTVPLAGDKFIPLFQVHTGAITVDTLGMTFQDVGGLMIAGPGTFAAVAASVALTTLVAQIALIWAELPA